VVVDDEPPMAQMLTDMLNLRGDEVTDEIRLQLALSGFICEPEVCDLVIADQSMSRISGKDMIDLQGNEQADGFLNRSFESHQLTASARQIWETAQAVML
jgi:DNA-binding response OmpR family regulator